MSRKTIAELWPLGSQLGTSYSYTQLGTSYSYT